jgi:hypothetical protein
MARKRQDPVDAAFALWAALDSDGQALFNALVKGYQAAYQPMVDRPEAPKIRRPRKQKPEVTAA